MQTTISNKLEFTMNAMSPFKSLRMPVENIIRFHLIVNGANEVAKDIE
jgi:hypothetical protein